jgi:hypothetical protein
MASPTKLNLKVYQGSTFRETLRWESALKVYAPITNISKSAPMVVTAANHGVPVGWRVKISGALGMKEANTGDNYLITSEVASNTVTFNSVNALNYTTYTGGGVLEYNQPVDLAGYTARMQIREKITSDTVLESLTSSNGKILLDNTNKSISLIISATTTAAYIWKTGVYSLELEKDGAVIPLIYGSVSVEPEVTR